MKDFRPKYSTKFSTTEHIHAARDISEHDKLLFIQFVNKFRHDVELAFYDRSVLKAVLDTDLFRMYFAEFVYRKADDETTEQIIVVLHKERRLWLCYRCAPWNAPLYFSAQLHGNV